MTTFVMSSLFSTIPLRINKTQNLSAHLTRTLILIINCHIIPLTSAITLSNHLFRLTCLDKPVTFQWLLNHQLFRLTCHSKPVIFQWLLSLHLFRLKLLNRQQKTMSSTTARLTNLLELIQSKQYDDDLSCENNNEENSSQPNTQRYGSSAFKQVPFPIEHHEEYDLALQKLQPSTKTRKTIIQRNLAKGNF